MHQAAISAMALALLFVASPLRKAQGESPLVMRVERIIKSKEPGWRYIRGIQSGRVPRVPGEKVLVTSVWEPMRKNGRRESVMLNMYEVPSASEAASWLKSISVGGVVSGWTVEKYQIGDEAYLSTYQDGRRFSLYVRKNNIVAEVSGRSLGSVKRFAQHAVSGVTAS